MPLTGSHRTKAKTVSEVIARPARTGIQGSAAWLLTELLETFIHLDKHQYALVLALLTLLVSAVQTAVENAAGKGFLRQVPPTSAPVVDDKDGV